jgi:hypothetical protein
MILYNLYYIRYHKLLIVSEKSRAQNYREKSDGTWWCVRNRTLQFECIS